MILNELVGISLNELVDIFRQLCSLDNREFGFGLGAGVGFHVGDHVVFNRDQAELDIWKAVLPGLAFDVVAVEVADRFDNFGGGSGFGAAVVALPRKRVPDLISETRDTS